MFSFGLSSVISKVSIATLGMFLFAGKGIGQKPLLFSNPIIICSANKYLSKVSGRNPKTRCEIC